MKGCGKELGLKDNILIIYCGLNYGNDKEMLGTYLCEECENDRI